MSTLSGKTRTALERQLSELSERRRELATMIVSREGVGDVADQAEGVERMMDVELLDSQIWRLTELLHPGAGIPEQSYPEGTIGPGREVSLVMEGESEEEWYLLAEREEASVRGMWPATPQSPLGQALLGHRAGDRVQWTAPGRVSAAKIVAIR